MELFFVSATSTQLVHIRMQDHDLAQLSEAVPLHRLAIGYAADLASGIYIGKIPKPDSVCGTELLSCVLNKGSSSPDSRCPLAPTRRLQNPDSNYKLQAATFFPQNAPYGPQTPGPSLQLLLLGTGFRGCTRLPHCQNSLK